MINVFVLTVVIKAVNEILTANIVDNGCKL